MMRRTAIAALLVCLSACGGSPSAPSTPTGIIHVVLHPQCASFITSVTILIDGAVAGTITPGGPELKVTVPLGSHTIAGFSTPARYSWSPSVHVLTASNPDYVSTFQCN